MNLGGSGSRRLYRSRGARGGSTRESSCRQGSTVMGSFDVIGDRSARERHSMLRFGSSMETMFEDVGMENSHNVRFRRVLMNPKFETFGGCVVLCNFLVMTIETNARTIPEDGFTLRVTEMLNRLFLVYYICECSARLVILGKGFFIGGGWNILDLVIVCTGIMGEILESAWGEQSSDGLQSVALLKSMRMLRLIRLLRLLVAFKELYVLVAGLAPCMKTLLWSCGLIFLSLNAWSIISVEYLQPLVQQLTVEGAYDSCEPCQVAFSNIWRSNVTWFAIVSGDGWTLLFWPLIERYYWPFFLLTANIFIICYGLLNLIIAAIVEASAQAREDDIKSAARMHRIQQDMTLNTFRELCKAIDSDNDGGISIEEFVSELHKNPELQNMLLVMGVEEQEIDGLFEIMDMNSDGTLEADEFVEQFYEMRTHVVKTSVYYVLRYCQKLVDMQKQQWKFLQELKCTHLEPWQNANVATPNAPDSREGLQCSMTNDSESQHAKHAAESYSDFASSPPPRASRIAFNSSEFTQSVEVTPPGWYYFGSCFPIGMQSCELALPKKTGFQAVLRTSSDTVKPSSESQVSCDGNTVRPRHGPQFFYAGYDKMEALEPPGPRIRYRCSNDSGSGNSIANEAIGDEFTVFPLDTSIPEKLPVLEVPQ